MILAIDTTSVATTVAVADQGEVLAEARHIDGRAHAEVLTPLIRKVVAAAAREVSEINDIAVGVGPGAFTGLRVGLMTAITLGQSLGIPVHGVMTLDVLAFESGIAEPFFVVTDALRKEVFWAEYSDFRSRMGAPGVGKPELVAQRTAGRPVVGCESASFGDLFTGTRSPELPSASALARLVEARLSNGGELLPPSPIYLRQPDAAVAAKPKSVLN